MRWRLVAPSEIIVQRFAIERHGYGAVRKVNARRAFTSLSHAKVHIQPGGAAWTVPSTERALPKYALISGINQYLARYPVYHLLRVPGPSAVPRRDRRVASPGAPLQPKKAKSETTQTGEEGERCKNVNS